MSKWRGNCYVAVEALWHILGGRGGFWKVMRTRAGNDTHWYLESWDGRIKLDPSRLQFKWKPKSEQPDYANGVHAAFLTKKPSKRAKALMKELTWQKS